VIRDLATEIQGTTMEDLERSSGERSEALRSGGSSMVERRSSGSEVPDPEVVARPKRRQFTA
jgi:hypothetical protein